MPSLVQLDEAGALNRGSRHSSDLLRNVSDEAATDTARRALASWLLSPAVGRRSDDGSVRIGNWLARDCDQNDGFYPEIGGYYLSFLTRVAGIDAPEDFCRQLSKGVLSWLERSGADGAPATIERRLARADDWRNSCLFTFDLAMIARGMLAVEHRWPGLVPPSLLLRYAAAAEAVGKGGRLGAYNLRPAAFLLVVPTKWSTQLDFQSVKAAAALEEIKHPVAAIAAATLGDWRTDKWPPVRELHPALYLVEGWLIVWARTLDAADLSRAASMFTAVLNTLHPFTFELPAVVDEGFAQSRGDTQAQMLRAGTILNRAGALDSATAARWHRLVPGVTTNLLTRISPMGGVAFDRRSGDRNSWASIFAWQALELSRPDRIGTPQEDASYVI